jgi:hypothetical protein
MFAGRRTGSRSGEENARMLRTPQRSLLYVTFAAAMIASGAALPLDDDRSVDAAPPGAPRVTLMGDSTLMAMEVYPNDDEMIAADYDVYLEVGNCRRLVRPSCAGPGRTPTPSALPTMQNEAKGRLGQVLVMMAGYDDFHDITPDIDAIMTEATQQGVGEVLWLTFRESPTYFLPTGEVGAPIYAQHNVRLRAAAQRWPSITVLDWNAHSIDHPEWFASDGIHLRPAGSVQLATFIKAALDARPLARCDARNALTGTPDVVEPVSAVAAEPAGFIGVTPARVLDTRLAELGGAAGMLGAGRTVEVPVAAVVPAGSVAAVVSVTAVEPCATGYLTVFPCGPLPHTSNVNYAARRNTAGLVISMLGEEGLCVHSSVATDLIVDVLGGFVPGGAGFHPIEPARWIDTRGGPVEVPSVRGPLVAGSAIDVPVRGRGAVPGDADAVMVNVTVAGATGDTVISLQPGPCAGTPATSALNVSPGRDGASSAIVALGPDGTMCATAFSGGGHLIVDVSGWFGDGGLRLRASTPERLVDTRRNGGAAIAAGASVPVPLAQASMLSVAMVDAAGPGWASVKPCGVTSTSSLLNTVPGEPMANATAVAPGSGGAICVSPSTAAHFVVDRTGTFVP